MWYNDLRPNQELNNMQYALTFYMDELKMTELEKKRTLGNLIALKEGINQKIPDKIMDGNILLASWNIKEFGHLKERLSESYFYIAEIISAFDIVAVQEIKTSLFDLDIVMKLLGSNYSYIITDITEGTKGNKERFGYIFDSRRVRHSGLSGELVIPPELADDNSIIKQLKRTPSISGFESGWKKFSVIGLHLHPGNKSDDKSIRREELRLLLEVLQSKLDNKRLWNENLILLGDTNIYDNNLDIEELVRSFGFIENSGLKGKPTNTSKTESYDRIFLKVDKYFKFYNDHDELDSGDVFDPFDYVFTEGMCSQYHDIMKVHKDDPTSLVDDATFLTYYNRYWKRNQISDHLPVWIEIEANSSISFLKSKMRKIILD
ncbi:endonuclease/exonuclease/phosphatase family protein [Rasiella rasia]|uniref:Endonuclease/exonuclease/phosphatase family protein n=1 Tax=Rasiella rasia TaxID=2744027 RepID=A0A6G6GQQ9_9FLAO|nr:endonuclease/exonuclease/phosphatase family protein [Rasiella rasia]QIE60804.1 endonuclease/exonuclease/phosphatase family protein [Rasiella rasia]